MARSCYLCSRRRQVCRLASANPWCMMYSRTMGVFRLSRSVRACSLMPGNLSSKPVPLVEKLIQPLRHRMPWG